MTCLDGGGGGEEVTLLTKEQLPTLQLMGMEILFVLGVRRLPA